MSSQRHGRLRDLPAHSPLRVPSLIVITDRQSATRAGRDLATTVAAALDGGAPAVLLRDKDLPRDQRRTLAEHLRELTAARGSRLFVSADADLARAVGADGVHLAASDPPLLGGAEEIVVGRSCHDRGEVAAARDEGVTYAFVSPVAPSPSKPGYGPVLGLAGFRELVRTAGGLPIIALGGVTADNAAAWRGAGAWGIAVMGTVMSATDPTTTVRRLLASWRDG